MTFARNTIAAIGMVIAFFFAAANAEGRSVSRVVCDVFGPRCADALAVARCESRLYPRARGAAGERGIFQIHPVHFGWLDESRLWEPRYNARIAFRMSRGGRSWRAWTCSP
jgi:hypothetical protein